MIRCRRPSWLAGGFAALASACMPDVAAPRVDRVTPGWGWNGEATDVAILGDRFYPQVTVSGRDDFEVDRQFEVTLTDPTGRATALEGVTLTDFGRLDARVPEALDAGRYDLTVLSPNGGTATLADAFTVSDTRADHLDLESDELTHKVESLARIGIRLLDPDDGPVAEPLAVAVRVVGVDDPATLQFEETLDAQRWDGTLPGVRGQLGPGGTGYLAFTSTVPRDLWVEVSPDDEASVVQGASQFVSFTAGGVAVIDVTLPAPDFVTEAGAEFPLRVTLRDEAGNPTDGVVGSLTLTERCGTAEDRFQRTLVFVDEIVILDAALTGATATEACAVNRIDAIGQANGVSLSGRSEDVRVTPAAPTALAVDAWPGAVTVGEDPLEVTVEARDAWGNRAVEVSGTPTLSDSVGGLGGDAGLATCRAFDGGRSRCEAWPVKAATSVRIVASTSGGLQGTSAPVRVLAGTPEALEVTVDPATVAAGDLFDLTLQAVDAYDNPVQLAITGIDMPGFADGAGTVSCVWTTTEVATARERFACAATAAEPEKVIRAVVPARALAGESDPFEVTNGALSAVTFDLGGVRAVTAGDPLDVTLAATDAFGNPYLLQAVGALDLYDDSGEISGQTVALDAGGEASVTLRPTVAWSANQLEARDGTTRLGRSPAYDVEAGVASGLEVAVDRTWAEVDDALDVTVSAVDAYGNTVPGYAQGVTLSSDAGAGDALAVTSFRDGVAEAAFTWDTAALQDTLTATDGSLSGSSLPVDAVTTCADGPTAQLRVDGVDELVLCRSGGATPTTSVSLAGSTSGASAIVAVHLAPEPDAWTRSTTSTTAWSWTEDRGIVVQGLVVDAAGCADIDRATVWIADNDGEPAGPVEIALGSAALVAGSTTLGATAVDVAAFDCAGDPAAGGTLVLRADLGALSSGTSTLAATGAGLSVLLDANGEAEVTFSMTTTPWDGVATVHAGVPSGAAHGAASATVSGEFAPPTVLDVTPSGTLSSSFSSIEVIFSEPMLASTLTDATIALTDPSGAAVTGMTYTLDADGDTLTLTLPEVVDGADGPWTLGIGSGARDAAGNRLDGAWTGASSAFVLRFGGVTDVAPDLTACAPSTLAIRPDGDDGAGDEGDDVELALSATATPAWWEVEVIDSDGDTVRLDREAGASAAALPSWDATDQGGAVVANGWYTLVSTALDAAWNRGASCATRVLVDNRIVAPGGNP